mmetsp:Transcript_81135/g.218009  ORF Transcript_81135/g.218009 Transcript_81135/m.218009 type:complete len:630 (-) Transcript_81135:159-2048(-)
MKSERVLIAVSCTLKIILAAALLIFYFAFNNLPKEILGCSSNEVPSSNIWLWLMFVFVFISEMSYHVALFMAGIIRDKVVDSFAQIVLMPTYWQWFFVATYTPYADSVWIPITVECVRSISVSFFRMQDKEDSLVNPLMTITDLLHGLTLLLLRGAGGCEGYPVAALHRQLAAGYMFIAGWVGAILKHRRLGRTANRPVRARLYFPIHHNDVECHERPWQRLLGLPRDSAGDEPRQIKLKEGLPCKAAELCRVTYHPELVIERYEMKPHWGDDSTFSYQRHTRKTAVAGKWVCVEVPAEAGILLAEQAADTGLKGQFRVLHALRDTKGVLGFWGDFKANLYAAKRYKKDPSGGWDLDNPNELEVEAERYAALNRHQRLVKPYFQDCFMQEKAAEFGRAFNATKNLPVRKVELLRACVMEVDWDSGLPQLYLVEPFLDDNTPFRKFNNNDFVPGQKATQNTPNLFSLFSYFHSNFNLVVCDIQGKKYKFTDPQFHTQRRVEEDDEDDFGPDDEDEGPDWLHSDGGFEMMRRVLYGLHKQRALHALCNRAWPEKMKALSDQVKEWEEDHDFMQALRELEKQAALYSSYFGSLDPTLDAAAAGLQVDAEDEHEQVMSKLSNKPNLTSSINPR